TAAREDISQRSLETDANFWQALGEIHCRCPRRHGLRSISLLCLSKPTRICSMRWRKSSPIPSVVLLSFRGSTGAISLCAAKGLLKASRRHVLYRRLTFVMKSFIGLDNTPPCCMTAYYLFSVSERYLTYVAYNFDGIKNADILSRQIRNDLVECDTGLQLVRTHFFQVSCVGKHRHSPPYCVRSMVTSMILPGRAEELPGTRRPVMWRVSNP